MRNKISHGIVFLGAISNAIILASMNISIWIIILTTVIYVFIFELIIYSLGPRLVRAERERNVTTYPFLRELVGAKKATVTLKDGTIIYNAKFEGYANVKDAKTILVHIATIKTKKEPSKIQEQEIKLADIASVKKIQ
ncbi:response regulator [Solibacillus sp. FSL K6-1523]|uniref:response regulator n=1 Tax=Solibacillus sp. FSL K6-1523 TaxID=2921471 RepID=UPI0030F8AFAE